MIRDLVFLKIISLLHSFISLPFIRMKSLELLTKILHEH